MLLLTLALAGAGIYTAVSFLQRSETLVSERCTAAVGTQSAELATDQAVNASLITAVAVQRGLPPRAASIALATAMQESKLRNIAHGDQAGPDSRGLFQQRPSQGWGTEAQVMNPYYAANAFYDALVKVPGYESLEITDAAQRVQRSAYPSRMPNTKIWAGPSHPAWPVRRPPPCCALCVPAGTGHPAAVESELAQAYGPLAITTENDSLVVAAGGAQAWSVAQWAVANAKAWR
ncbi:conserved hypothetical protein [Arthrobacter sp. Hiyo4]|nr:conserved hypothetical protein [Arthrobacter sp. Hiyo4]